VVNILHRHPIIELEPTVRPVDLESGSWVNTWCMPLCAWGRRYISCVYKQFP